ncbi:integrin alpha-8-like [Lytechinus pictus]|uniref:integrin alpha-8-like n=1 Tax=Lytechinus pictus TaxID=7653 RepID=UPI0030B9AEBA
MDHLRNPACLGFLFYSIFQLVILIMFTDYIHAFNIDVSSPSVYQGSPESYFGFAVEPHREGNQNMILVGAPRAQTDQTGVNRGGAVYKCPVNTNHKEPTSSPSSSSWVEPPDASQSFEVPRIAKEIPSSPISPDPATLSPDTTSASSCQQIPFDTSGNEFIDGDQITNKSGQMLGMTIKSSGPDGTVIVCRPLYTWFYLGDSHPDTRRFPVGGCFFSNDNFTRVSTFNPCITYDSSRVNFLRCVFGLSAAISETEWIIGAVGAFYAQGELYVGNFSSTTTTVRRSDVIDNINYDFTYRGSSVAFGDFFGDGEVEYVTGVPRGSIHHRGLVEFRDRALRNYLIINGHQIGSYFGHALVVADFNHDGYDDIIISAPMYTAYDMPITDGWEIGRIHIYYNDRQGEFPVSHTISGEWPGGRFGYTMTKLGDINRDGYIDLAVSAPYFGDEKEGRVSIYLSSGSRGLSPTPSQHISPSMFGMRMTSFGFSLGGGLDVDNNTYPDLVVGSYLSSTVLLFRSRPVVNLNITLTLKGMKGIDLDEHDLLLQDGSHVASFNVSLCIQFTGVALPEQMDVSYTLSSIDQTLLRSMLLLPNGYADSFSQVSTLSKDISRCIHLTGFIMNSIRDKLTPIRYRVDYAISNNQESYDGILSPILDSKIEPHKELSIPFIYDCNSTICVPDLSIAVSSDTSVIIVGAPAVIHLNLSISNHGEDAYESVLNFTQPNNFQFVQVIQLRKNNRLITCDKKAGRADLVCDLGNPMKANEQILIQLVFAAGTVEGDFTNFSFVMETSSTHNDSTPINNRVSIGVNVTVKSELSFEGAADNEYLLYDYERGNTSMTDEEPNMIHRYMLRNRGPSDIGRTTVLIYFPHSVSDSTTDHDIIELIDAEVEGGDKCDVVKVVTDKILSTTNTSPDDDSSVYSSTAPSSQHDHQLSTLSPTNNPTKPVFGGRSPARRRKRRADIGVSNNMTQDDYISFEDDIPVIECLDGTVCYEITCHIDTLGTRKTSFRDSATIIVMSRFNVDLFLKLSPELNTTSLAVVSNADVLVYGSEYTVQLPANISFSATATTRVVAMQQIIEDNGNDSNPYQPGPIPKTSIWMIILACLVGVALLAGTNAILYKMGFFKRQRIGMEDRVLLRKKPDRMSIRQRSVIFDDD